MDSTVTLHQMLDARESRSLLRRRYFASCENELLLQFTLNIPGNRKNSDIVQQIFAEGLTELESRLPEILFLKETDAQKLTGPEGYGRISGSPLEIKKILCESEENHPLGRLWDFDLFASPDRSLSREEAGHEGRLCLICDKPAHQCSRSRSHSIEDIHGKILKMCMNYFAELSFHAV